MGGVPFGEYLLLGRLASGGMAEVFLAKSLLDSDGRLYAVKRTLPHLAEHTMVLSMFADEARIVSAFEHENIATIFDRGGTANQLYLVMEFVHGRDLKGVRRRARKRGEPLPAAVIAHVIARVASALDYAHRLVDASGRPQRIVHRDVSPQNILVSYAGQPKLIDFGIAKARDRMAETQSGVVKGKYNYMSPEQARGDSIDWRTDIYALGITLYELLSGVLPFAASSRILTLQNTARGKYTPVREVNPDIPKALAEVIDNAMALHREERYQAAAEMEDDLEAFVAAAGEPLDAATVADIMRRLFSVEYDREREQIAELSAIEPPPEAVAAARAEFPEVTEVDARPAWLDGASAAASDTTSVQPSPELAAGFPVDGPMSGEGSLTPDGFVEATKPTTVVELARFELDASTTSGRAVTEPVEEPAWTTGAVEEDLPEEEDDERADTVIVGMPDFIDSEGIAGTEVVDDPFAPGDDEPQ